MHLARLHIILQFVQLRWETCNDLLLTQQTPVQHPTSHWNVEFQASVESCDGLDQTVFVWHTASLGKCLQRTQNYMTR